MSGQRRLDKLMTERGMVRTRSQAESWIRLGRVKVNGKPVTKPGFFASASDTIQLDAPERYVSRAGLKLASVADALKIDFNGQLVLDVGSSTGGFTDYALQHGAKKVIAVDVGTEQLHPSLRADPRIELHEKTDIRDFRLRQTLDSIVMDVSFVGSRQILPHLQDLAAARTDIIVMVKPQFEARRGQLTAGGVVKNERVRREILREFEQWAKQLFVIKAKADSGVAGERGNLERFYRLGRANTAIYKNNI